MTSAVESIIGDTCLICNYLAVMKLNIKYKGNIFLTVEY